VIVAMHVASGAAGGALAGSRARALALGPLLHMAGDLIPHRDIPSRRFEILSGLALLGLFAATRGPLDPAVLGGAAAAAPDLEHVVPLPKPGGRKLFPSHRFHGWHQEGGVPAWAQLAVASALAAAVVSRAVDRGSRPR
jgi:hypothetical protein